MFQEIAQVFIDSRYVVRDGWPCYWPSCEENLMYKPKITRVPNMQFPESSYVIMVVYISKHLPFTTGQTLSKLFRYEID